MKHLFKFIRSYQCMAIFLTLISVNGHAGSDETKASTAGLPVNDKTLLVIGDSLSAAYKLPAKQGWVHLLEQRLQQNYDDQFQVVNASISGATTAAAIQLLSQSLTKYTPSIVILELGGNDGLQGKPVTYITENLRTLVHMSKGAGAQVLLVGVRMPPNFGSRYADPFFKQYARLAEQESLALVPFILDGVAGHEDLMLSDGLHPSAPGQEVVLENVWKELKPLLGI
ncbi:Esterase TesA [Thalassocella blandensis]|nr:Esterase TesA [Thalassocella blandensis]